MSQISIEAQPQAARLAALGVENWPIWTGAASGFPWQYESSETCYFLDVEVRVTPIVERP